MVHDGDSVAQPVGFLYEMGSEQHRVTFPAQLGDEVQERQPALGVEAPRHLPSTF
jgi:hypothetical protein